ncbi:MAG: FMN-binding negative transcriptional regulator [Chitinophagaceae bacterium]
MYHLPHFKTKDQQEVVEFMKAHPFAMLIGVADDGVPVATQVPVLLDEKKGKLFLTGHIQRKSDHHKALEQNSQVLIVFTGAHSYVSASWYTNPQVASTWNYMSVHAKGVLRFLNDEELRLLLDRTTSYFENNPHSPALMKHIPEDYIQSNMKAIVAFEVEVHQLDHVFKLSQNRDAESYDRIVQELKQQGGEAATVAQVMQERKHKQNHL